MIIPVEVNATLKDIDSSSMLAISDLSMTASNNYQNNFHTTTRSVRQPNKTIVGLVYVQDYLPHLASSRNFAEISVGTVILSEKSWPSNARQLRQLIINDSIFNLDNQYIFLSNIGSPILLTQEPLIEVNYLINGQNTIKFRRGVAREVRCPLIGYYSNNHGVFLGYIKATYETELKLLRKKVDDVIKETNFSSKTNSYYFVHSLYYPISRNNESNIVLVDIIQNSCIFIKFDTSFDTINDIRDRPLNIQYKYSSNDDICNMTIVEDQTDAVIVKSTKTKSNAGRRKTLRHKLTFKGSNKKQIMISYVRREAAEHALSLKMFLIKCGYSVYLDVHEIQMGGDWQDSLNSAVQNCNFFVPLITQNYGRTQWTNREVKLADVLNKHIIPINFLDVWPPECLAIQFATTQYIPWKPKTSDHNTDELKDKENDAKIWDFESIEQVTKMIVEQVEKISKKNEIGKRDQIRGGETISVPNMSPETISHSVQKEKPLIVISAHPDQQSISNAIKVTLSSDYQVWCSNDLSEIVVASSTMNNDCANFELQSETNLSPIIEENTPLTHATQNYARKIAEMSKQRPKSVPNNDNDMKVEIKKKDLVRVALSYNGEASYLSSISPDKMDRLKGFQEKVLQSSLVVILASNQYYKSRTSEQHVYYCGQRKKTILVQCDKSSAPVWFSKLMSHDTPLNYDSPIFNNELMSKINNMLDPACKFTDLHEVKIKYLTDCMKQNLPNIETCVYVFGSTELTNPRTIEICKEIGKELAEVSNINIVTNGFYGTGDLVAHTFVQERKSNFKESKSNDSVVHIVPLRDSKNYKHQCRQKTDHTFEKVSYGQTLFLGESIKERDSVLARLLDTSILIEGDEHTAHEIEEFIWNDHFVIPVKSTGGAAGGQFDVPQKIFSCPTGVRESEWEVLSKPDATPAEVAKAVVHVICDLKKAIHEHAVSKNVTNVKKTFSDRPLKKRTAVRKRINIDVNQRSVVEERHDKQIEPASPEKVLPIFPDNESMQIGTTKIGFRERFNKLIKQFTKH